MTEQRQPWAKWYWSDWRADVPLRMCSYSARGLWADLLSLMAESTRYGFLLINGVQPTVTQLTALLGGAERDVKKYLAELGAAGVFSRTGDLPPLLTAPPDHISALIPEEIGKGVILSRRMVRDKAKAERDRQNGKSGGNPRLKGEDNPPEPKPAKTDKPGVNPPVKAQKPEARSQTDKEGSSIPPIAGASAPPASPPVQAKRPPLTGEELGKLLRGNGKEISAEERKDIWFQRIIAIAKETMKPDAFTRWMLAVDAEEPWAKRETERLNVILRERQTAENAAIMDAEQAR